MAFQHDKLGFDGTDTVAVTPTGGDVAFLTTPGLAYRGSGFLRIATVAHSLQYAVVDPGSVLGTVSPVVSGSHHTRVSFRCFVRLNSYPTAADWEIFEVGDAAQVFCDTTGHIGMRCMIAADTSINYMAAAMPLDVWLQFLVSIDYDPTSGFWVVTSTVDVEGAGTATDVDGFTGTPAVGQIVFGDAHTGTAQTGSIDFDSVEYRASGGTGGDGDAPLAPLDTIPSPTRLHGRQILERSTPLNKLVVDVIPEPAGTPALGDVLVFDGSDWIRKAVGDDGEFLAADSGEPDGLSWATPAGGGGGGGGLVLLEQHTASASSALNFTSAITSTYDEYVIELIDILPTTNSVEALLEVSTNGGSTYDTGANYATAFHRWSRGGDSVAGSASDTAIDLAGVLAVSNDATEQGLSGTLRFYNPLGTAGWKKFTGQVTWWYPGSPELIGASIAAAYKSATAVDALRIRMSSGTIASGIGRIYGVEK